MELLEVENGKITYTPGAPETIREKAKYYITDPKEIEAYNEFKNIADAYNRLLKVASEKCKLTLKINGISDFMDFDQKTFKAKPSEDLNYWLIIK